MSNSVDLTDGDDRTKITVLGPDDPNKPPIGWIVYEGYPPIFTMTPAMRELWEKGELAEHLNGWPMDENGKEPPVITDPNGLREGMEVIIMSRGGWAVFTVSLNESGEPYAEDEFNLYFFEFNGTCWGRICQCSKKAFSKMKSNVSSAKGEDHGKE